MKFIIRKADLRKPENRTVLTYLQQKCLPHDKPMDVSYGHWWIAYTEDGKPVGFAGMVRSAQWINAGYLCRAGVLRTHTGYGLQKKLIQARINQARKLNWEWVLTDTTDNPASANSLISMGFKLYEPSVPWAFKNSLYWRLNVLSNKKHVANNKKSKQAKPTKQV